jgi:threonine aldolase
MIDLRSDTITKPTPEMLEAMMGAQVGDDVFGDDPSVNALELKAANMFGMEDALFVATGTMANQIAIRIHCSPGSEVICDELSHIYLYEGGGVALNAGASIKAISGDRGRINAQQVLQSINNPMDVHQPITRLVSLENTMNKGGGSIYNFEDILAIRNACDAHELNLHLDGARLFNALIETAQTPTDYGAVFDSISICLSKGLACPVGSILLGRKDLIQQARRYRKVMGGGWRQAGYLAAAGVYALDHHVDRLKDDHLRAKEIESLFNGKEYVKEVYPVESNIVIIRLNEDVLAEEFVQKLSSFGIAAVTFGKHLVRFVTHIDFTDQDLEIFSTIVRNHL